MTNTDAKTGAGATIVERTEFLFDSHDGASQVRAVVWVPADVPAAPAARSTGAASATVAAGEAPAVRDAGGPRPDCADRADGEPDAFRPRGVVQLIHGMAEHIDRYDAFARFLAGRGYLVVGHDHIGHGETAATPDRRGVLHPRVGARAMIDDVQRLRLIASKQAEPGTPYFMFGHSMGSLVLRSYLPRYGSGLAGAVMCGTANQPTAVSAAGNALARGISRLRGAASKSALLHALVDGAYARAVKDARTPLDWLSHDEAVVDAYIDDERCGFMFSAGAYAALTELAHTAALPATYRDTPRDVPLLFVSGDEDPVGDKGRGVAKAAGDMERAGARDVTLKLFPGMRHEILNEIGKEEVYGYVLDWLEAHRIEKA